VSTTPDKPPLKPLKWIGSSRVDLQGFPEAVRKEGGHALHLVQAGETPLHAKPLRGFGGAGVLEIVENYGGNTYRAVYTVPFAEVVFVLHSFQKKSRKGIATPKQDIDLIKRRLRTAGEMYQQLYRGMSS
jgi:phage-related protein